MVSSVLPLAFSAIAGSIAAKKQQKAAKSQQMEQSVEQNKIEQVQMQQESTLKDEENNQKRLRTEQLKALRGRSGARSLIATSDKGLSGLSGLIG
jgi:hypothetical protein